jgi:hypothetical protein
MAERHGLPGAVYSDRHGIFTIETNRPATLVEQLTGKRSLTQVGRALDEAQVAWIGAHSAPAKGRVERLWGDTPGPARHRAAPGRDHVDRNGQRLPAGLSRAPQRAVRRAGRRSGARLESVARRPELAIKPRQAAFLSAG